MMKSEWYAASTISLVLLIVSGLVACTPTATVPVSSPDEGGVPPTSASSTYDSGAAEIPTNSEPYYCGDFVTDYKFLTLETIYSKTGNGSFRDVFTVGKSPWVVNWKYDQTSNIGSSFNFCIWEQGYSRPRSCEFMPTSGYGFRNAYSGTLSGVYNLIYYDTGNFNIDIVASGCKWWIKLGIEPNRGAANSSQTMIIGKWQHGISDCPPHIDKRFCEKLKKLPENKLYYLEFFDDGHVDRIASGWDIMGGFTRFGGRYSLIGSKLEINWDLEGHEAYDIRELSENEMVLQNEMGGEEPFHRVD